MGELVERVVELSSPWAYLVVGALAAGEGAALLGLVLPGELSLLLGGVLAASGDVNVVVMCAVAACATLGGDAIGWAVGRRAGPALRGSRLGRRVPASAWDRAERGLRHRLRRTVFIGRFVGVLRALLPVVAGGAGIPLRRYLLADIPGALLYAPAFVLLGFVLRDQYERIAGLAGRAGLVLLALLVVAGALTWAARWVARHPERVRPRVRQVLDRPLVRALAQRYRTQLAFVRRRLTPGRALGLSVTVGLLALLAAGWAFGAIVEDIVQSEELATVDSPVTAWLSERRVGWLTTAMRAVSQLGALPVATGLTALLAALLWRWSRTAAPALLLCAAGGGAALLALGVKLLVARPRPTADALAQVAATSAFPSGRVTVATAMGGALAAVVARAAPTWGARVTAWAVALALTLLIGFADLYLGRHWLSDVLGGGSLGAAWLAVVLTADHERRRARSATRAEAPGDEQVASRP